MLADKDQGHSELERPHTNIYPQLVSSIVYGRDFITSRILKHTLQINKGVFYIKFSKRGSLEFSYWLTIEGIRFLQNDWWKPDDFKSRQSST